jgi:hypothetical protein
MAGLVPAGHDEWFLRNRYALRAFSLHEDKTDNSSLLRAAAQPGRRIRAGAADQGDAGAADCASTAARLRQLRADVAGWDEQYRTFDGWPRRRRRSARRQARPVRRRAVPAVQRRPGDARARTRDRQDAGDPATRQPRRRPDGAAEIGPKARIPTNSEPPALLDRLRGGSLYAARSRLRSQDPRGPVAG